MWASTQARCWEACSVRSDGSSMFGPQTSPWPIKWSLEEFLGRRVILNTFWPSACELYFELFVVLHRRVHISQSTMDSLHGEFEVEAGNGGERCEYLLEKGIETYLILVPKEVATGPNGKVSVALIVHTPNVSLERDHIFINAGLTAVCPASPPSVTQQTVQQKFKPVDHHYSDQWERSLTPGHTH